MHPNKIKASKILKHFSYITFIYYYNNIRNIVHTLALHMSRIVHTATTQGLELKLTQNEIYPLPFSFGIQVLYALMNYALKNVYACVVTLFH